MAPKIGLKNIGTTYYVNSILQCFCHIKKFIEFFKYNPILVDIVKKDKNKKTLSSSFKLLIENLWPKKNNQSNSNKYYEVDIKICVIIVNKLCL